MPKRSRSIDEPDANEDYESDGGFVRDEDNGRKKKPKPSKSSAKAPSGSGNAKGDDEPSWELSSSARAPRRVAISEFKNSRLVSIREYYENNDGKLLPSKKGISLTVDQYNNLLRAIPEINAKLAHMGENVHGFSGQTQESGDEDELPVAKKVKAKSEKSNIEATSDENED